MTLFRNAIAAIGAIGLLAGCATDRSYGTSPDLEVTQLEQLPAPNGEYVHQIGALETLEIVVAGSELLSGTFLTDESGRISFPFIGRVGLAGLSPLEASELIENGLRGEYLLDPQVRVMPSEFPQPSVSIGGQVENPGSYPASTSRTLLRLVNQAGGATEYAKLDDVLIMRTVGEQRYIGAYSLAAIERGNYADPIVYPNDIVMVGDSPARRRMAAILQFVPLLTSSAIIIDRAAN